MTRMRYLLLIALALLPCGRVMAVDVDPADAEVDPVRALRALQREHDALLAQLPALQEAAAKATELAEQNRQLDE